MGNLKLADLRDIARGVGVPETMIDTAAAVAMAESSGNPSAANVVTSPAPGNLPERSFGLWQINALAHPSFDEAKLLDPDYNARAMFMVSSGGLNWKPWSTFNAPLSNPRSYLHWMPGGDKHDSA